MRPVRCDRMSVWVVALALVGTIPAAPIVDVPPLSWPHASPALEFVQVLCSRIDWEEIECRGPWFEREPDVRCGTTPHRAVHQAAQAVALVFAERDVDVLDVGVPLNAPPEQLADLPGFDPVPDIPGQMWLVYLIGEHRVLIGVDIPLLGVTASEAPPVDPRQVVIKVEPLDGPFPHILPASQRSER